MFIKNNTVVLSTLCLTVAFLGIYVLSKNSESPKEVVVKFFGKINEKDIESVKGFLINEPDYVYQKAFFTEDANNTSEAGVNSTVVSRKSSIKLSSDELLKSVIPDLFFIQNRFLSDIVKIEEKEKEARVRVKVGSAELADIQYDILLYKNHNEWKIFAIRNVKNFEADDPYDFYAVSQ